MTTNDNSTACLRCVSDPCKCDMMDSFEDFTETKGQSVRIEQDSVFRRMWNKVNEQKQREVRIPHAD